MDVFKEVKLFLTAEKGKSEGARIEGKRHAKELVVRLQELGFNKLTASQLLDCIRLCKVTKDSALAEQVFSFIPKDNQLVYESAIILLADMFSVSNPRKALRMLDNVEAKSSKAKASKKARKIEDNLYWPELYSRIHKEVDEKGFMQAALSCCLEVSRTMCSQNTGPSVLQHDISDCITRPIFISGFGWSGSGAVFDFMKQFDQFPVFAEAEMGFIGDVPHHDNSDDEYWSWVFRNILGVPLTEYEKSKPGKFKNGSVIANMALAGCDQEYTYSVVAQFIAETEPSAMYDDHEFYIKFRSFLKKLIRLKVGSSAKFALFNNSLRPYNHERLYFAPNNPVIIGVARDIRDHFVEIRLVGKAVKAAHMSSRAKRVKEFIEISNSNKDDFRFVEFGQFVKDSDYRQALIESLGCQFLDCVQVGEFFFPEESVKNVGVWKKYSDDPEIRELAKSYPELCFS